MNAPVDISPGDLETIREILAKHVPEYEVWAFGSRVAWTARQYSDLDLAVMTEEPLDIMRMADLKEAFTESDLPFRVDIADWASTSESFQQIIKNQHVTIRYKSKKKLNVPKGWQTVSLGDCVVINDSTYSPKESWPFINYLDTGNITENRISKIQNLIAGKDKIPIRARRKVQSGDIVYSTVRPNQKHFGLLREIPENFLASTGFSVIRGKNGFTHTNFIYWFLTQNHIIEQLQTIAEHSTSTYPSVIPTDIERLKLSLPPLSEQKAIANVLDTLDGKMELNRQMSETLEAMAQALFKSWFVDFDPVRAKMEGRWRRSESLPGLPSYLWDFFPDRLQISQLGEVPRNWDIKALGEVAVGTKGCSYKSTEIAESNTALVTLKSFNKGGGYQSGGLKPYTGPYKPEQVVETGEVIVACTDITQNAEVVGRPAMVQPDSHYTKFIASLDTMIVRPNSDRISNEFLYLLCGTSSFTNHTYSYTTGTTVLHLAKEAIPSFQFVLPTHDIMLAFGKIAANIYKKISCLGRENNILTELRNMLLPKLVSGELHVHT